MAYKVKNRAKGTVSGGYSATETSIDLLAGHGSRFNDTSVDGPFLFAWWNATDYADPSDDPDFEICLCLSRTGDTFVVIERGKEGTSASAKNLTGKTYKVLAGITAGMWNAQYTLSQTARGLEFGTHPDANVAASKTMFSADAIVMSDGEEVRDWRNIETDIAINGVGGLDTGAESSSAWYEQYAIYNGVTKAGCLHRAKQWALDLDGTAGEDATQGIRSNVDNSTVRVGQGFLPTQSGKIPFVDVKLIRVGTVTGNIWFTLESDGTGGVPSGTVLATSWKFDASLIPTTAGGTIVRFPFHEPYAVSASTRYHVVARGDWAVSNTNYIGWRMDGSASTSIPNGSKALWDSDTETWTLDTDDDMWLRIYVETHNVDFASTVPSGYSYALIGYVYNNSAGNFVPCIQIGTTWRRLYLADGQVIDEMTASRQFVDLRAFIPPLRAANVLFGLTGTGSAAAACAIGAIRSTNIVNGTNAGAQIGLRADASTEFVQASQEVLLHYAAASVDGTSGADLYALGFRW